MTVKQKHMVKRKARRAAAWTVLCSIEAIIAAVPAAILAVVLIPFVAAQRGYYAYGGEWFAVLAVFYLAYLFIHKKVCDELFREEEEQGQ